MVHEDLRLHVLIWMVEHEKTTWNMRHVVVRSAGLAWRGDILVSGEISLGLLHAKMIFIAITTFVIEISGEWAHHAHSLDGCTLLLHLFVAPQD